MDWRDELCFSMTHISSLKLAMIMTTLVGYEIFIICLYCFSVIVLVCVGHGLFVVLLSMILYVLSMSLCHLPMLNLLGLRRAWSHSSHASFSIYFRVPSICIDDFHIDKEDKHKLITLKFNFKLYRQINKSIYKSVSVRAHTHTHTQHHLLLGSSVSYYDIPDTQWALQWAIMNY